MTDGSRLRLMAAICLIPHIIKPARQNDCPRITPYCSTFLPVLTNSDCIINIMAHEPRIIPAEFIPLFSPANKVGASLALKPIKERKEMEEAAKILLSWRSK